MKPSIEAYTVALPWYERADFQRLWESADDHHDMPSDYDVWHASALSVINAWLARGRALQIVTIKPVELPAWLESQALPNTAATRLKYVESKATGAAAKRSEEGSQPVPTRYHLDH